MGQLVGGLDGCPVGWVLVATPADGKGSSCVKVVTDLGRVFDALDSGELAAVSIDIPIGLPACGPRLCDVEARKLIGERRSSVFPAPLRAVLAARTYDEAATISRSISDKSLSKQAFAILSKIRDVDDLITPEKQKSWKCIQR